MGVPPQAEDTSEPLCGPGGPRLAISSLLTTSFQRHTARLMPAMVQAEGGPPEPPVLQVGERRHTWRPENDIFTPLILHNS